MFNPFVPDGYTETQSINSVEGLWQDDLYKVTFRPPVAWELDQVLGDLKTGPTFLASKIVSWTLANAPTEENIKLLHSSFYSRLLAVVAGWARDKDGNPLQSARNADIKN